MGLLKFLGRKAASEPAPDFSRFFEGKTFTREFSPAKAAHWVATLPALREDARDILEIGSWEGRSAVFLLESLPKARITCIDTFEGSVENFDTAEAREITANIERRFDANLQSYGDRVRKIKSRSVPGLDSLSAKGETFDLIYIDGSHRRDDVFADTAAAWPLLRVGGIMVWDDFTWRRHLPSPDRPQDAILLFIKAFASCIEEIKRGKQLSVRKTADWPKF